MKKVEISELEMCIDGVQSRGQREDSCKLVGRNWLSTDYLFAI